VDIRSRSAALLAAGLLVASCRGHRPPENPKDYAATIAADRAVKNAAFAASDDPIPKARHAEFLPLAYFPIDPDYHVPAAFRATEDPAIIEMPTSTGTPRRMRRVGTLDFTLKGQPLALVAFLEVGERTKLFVAFNDLTSGKDTYGGGRFMDLDRNATGIYEVDFNRAYFPYCYYNPTFECPLPPKENRLTMPITAGERLRSAP
jgi:uncharacterized protein (DUF1684 family)